MRFLPPQRFNKNSKKYRSPIPRGASGQIDGRTFKRDPRSRAIIFNPLPSDIKEKVKEDVLKEELQSTKKELKELRDLVFQLSGLKTKK